MAANDGASPDGLLCFSPMVDGRRERTMSDEVYTLGEWRVKAGREADFIAAWQALGRYFAELPNPPGEGTLVQSVDDPQLFYSFGPWDRLEDIEEMRSQPETPAEIGKLMELCEEGRPGAFRVVATA